MVVVGALLVIVVCFALSLLPVWLVWAYLAVPFFGAPEPTLMGVVAASVAVSLVRGMVSVTVSKGGGK